MLSTSNGLERETGERTPSYHEVEIDKIGAQVSTSLLHGTKI